jgi:hypothetical protein
MAIFPLSRIIDLVIENYNIYERSGYFNCESVWILTTIFLKASLLTKCGKFE